MKKYLALMLVGVLAGAAGLFPVGALAQSLPSATALQLHQSLSQISLETQVLAQDKALNDLWLKKLSLQLQILRLIMLRAGLNVDRSLVLSQTTAMGSEISTLAGRKVSVTSRLANLLVRLQSAAAQLAVAIKPA